RRFLFTPNIALLDQSNCRVPSRPRQVPRVASPSPAGSNLLDCVGGHPGRCYEEVSVRRFRTSGDFMRLNRRNLLTSMATVGAGLAMPSIVRAEDNEFWDIFGKERAIKNVDTDGNTATAKALIDTIEPIL